MQSSVNSCHSYPHVFGIQFALDYDLVEQIDEKHYNGCQDINATCQNIKGQIANQQSTEEQIKELRNKLANKSDLEGIDIRIDVHGYKPKSSCIPCVLEESVQYLKEMFKEVNNYLKNHKDTKAYIRLENCYGNVVLNVCNEKEQVKKYNILKLASELLDEDCKKRVYCRQVAVKAVHSTSLSGKLDHKLVKIFKDVYNTDRFCKTIESSHVVFDPSKEEYQVELVKDADCFDYFPLSQYKDHSNEKYYGVQGKQEKNKFLQWTKWNGQNEEKPNIHGNYPSQKRKETTNYKKRSDIKYKDECWFKKGIKNACKCITQLCCKTKRTNNNETQNNINNTKNAFVKPIQI